MGFFRQEYWSGLPFTIPGDLTDPGMELASLVSTALTGRFFFFCLIRQILYHAPSGKTRGPRVSTLIWDYRRTVIVGNEKTQGWVDKVRSDRWINHIWANHARSTDSWFLGAWSHVNTEYSRKCRRRGEQGWAQRLEEFNTRLRGGQEGGQSGETNRETDWGESLQAD